MAAHMTAVYSSPETYRKAPHVEALSLGMTLVRVASLHFRCFRQGYQLSFLSSISPITCTERLGWIVEVGNMKGQELLYFVNALVKDILLWGKQRSMSFDPLQAPLRDILQHSTVFLY
jgi:hypothetical protein